MRAVLQGRVISIINSSFVAKSGQTWFTTVYQILGGYKGHPFELENLQVMEPQLEPPHPDMLKASKSGESVTMLVDIRRNFRAREGDPDLAVRFLQVSPQGNNDSPLFGSSNGSRQSSSESSSELARTGGK